MRILRTTAALGLVAVTAAACGSSSSAGSVTPKSSMPPPGTATVTDTVVPPTSSSPMSTPPTTSATSGPTICPTSALRFTLGSAQGDAGLLVRTVLATNVGAATCELNGYSGVSFVAPGTGRQVGAAATRDSGGVPLVTLKHGAAAEFEVRIVDYQNYPAASCAATAVSGLRVYPPGNTTSAYLPLPTVAQRACSTRVPQLGVREFTGTTGTG